MRRGFEFVRKPRRASDSRHHACPSRNRLRLHTDRSGSRAGNLKVKTFTEKPNLELAKVFLDSGEFFWNSGIFLWKASSIISALHKYDPDLTCLFDRGVSDFGTPREMEFINANFTSCPPNSIDYAVMEKADNVYVECEFRMERPRHLECSL